MPHLKRNGQLSRESEKRGRLADHDVYQCGITCDVAAAYRIGLLSVTAHLLYGGATKSSALDSLPEELRALNDAHGPVGDPGSD